LGHPTGVLSLRRGSRQRPVSFTKAMASSSASRLQLGNA
jgi:hypothetical protein